MLMNRNAHAREQGFATGALLFIMTICFVLSLAFGVWAFIGMQDNQKKVDQKVAAATQVAVQQAESAKEAEFTERDKNPFRTYSGTPTYGSLTFDFPKSWNVFAEEKNSGTLLDFYAHPGLIPGLSKDVNFAFRTQILDTSYDKEAKKFESQVKSGKVSIDPMRPELVPSELGVYIKGEVVSGKKGAMVLLPQRDKTFKIWTESEEYLEDFDKIIATIYFIP